MCPRQCFTSKGKSTIINPSINYIYFPTECHVQDIILLPNIRIPLDIRQDPAKYQLSEFGIAK